MQLAWTHLLPSTFGGTAMSTPPMPWLQRGPTRLRRGVGLHGSGACGRSPLNYLSPGRMNLIDVRGIGVVADYCRQRVRSGTEGARPVRRQIRRPEGRDDQQSGAKISRIGMVCDLQATGATPDMRELYLKQRDRHSASMSSSSSEDDLRAASLAKSCRLVVAGARRRSSRGRR